jgi:hypothetical protein
MPVSQALLTQGLHFYHGGGVFSHHALQTHQPLVCVFHDVREFDGFGHELSSRFTGRLEDNHGTLRRRLSGKRQRCARKAIKKEH